MKPLFVLLIVFVITLLFQKLFFRHVRSKKAGNIALGAMFIFTAVGHFIYTKGMSAMIPDFFPSKISIVYATGILKILFAAGLWLPKFSKKTAWLIILFLISVLPMNIYAAIHHVNYQTGELNGEGIEYLWIRVPLQFFYISWTYFFGVRDKSYTHYCSFRLNFRFLPKF